MSFLDWSKHFLRYFQELDHDRLPSFKKPTIDTHMLLFFNKLAYWAGAETTPVSGLMLARKLH
jgi:hypothetical protein